jgi:hypothetical protein
MMLFFNFTIFKFALIQFCSYYPSQSKKIWGYYPAIFALDAPLKKIDLLGVEY